MTCSFGLAEHRMGESVASLIKRVDTSLCRAKEKGRNRVEVAA